MVPVLTGLRRSSHAVHTIEVAVDDDSDVLDLLIAIWGNALLVSSCENERKAALKTCRASVGEALVSPVWLLTVVNIVVVVKTVFVVVTSVGLCPMVGLPPFCPFAGVLDAFAVTTTGRELLRRSSLAGASDGLPSAKRGGSMMPNHLRSEWIRHLAETGTYQMLSQEH